ncbi:aldehyde dehydrogenase family protein [Prosthecochloris sp. GSB1]|nr:aldehyde dehydrogenase family protein [Prosthecochloris sp. GSB1]
MAGRQEASAMCAGLRKTFETGVTRSYEWRKTQLRSLRRFLVEREEDIYRALDRDFRKSRAETFFTEIHYLTVEIDLALRKLKSWMEPVRVSTPLRYRPGRSGFHFEPHGVVLVIGAWNYPLQLALAPAVSAIAAGNCVLVKPSERSPATSALMEEGLERYLDRNAVRVFAGDAEESLRLLKERFDYIFFTGGSQAGRKVMQAAAENLTPVTLELGGKNPCIVDRSADIGVAARRIVWAKFLNAGQTCIAPDFVLVESGIEERLVNAMKDAIGSFYGSDPSKSVDYPAVITQERLERLVSYLGEGRVASGGDFDRDRRYFAPTILTGVSPESPVMKDEIFGPVLPVVGYGTREDALVLAGRFRHPLALYIFSTDRSFIRFMLDNTRSGGVAVNDLLFQAAIPGLPFGGAGQSGMGAYHGRTGFETFSRPRSVHVKRTFPENRLRYPPFGKVKFRLLRALFRLIG